MHPRNSNFAILFCGILFAAISLLTAPTTAQQQQVTVHLLGVGSEREAIVDAPNWHAKFTPQQLQMHMGTSAEVLLELTDLPLNAAFEVLSENPNLASVQHLIPADVINSTTLKWRGNITVDAIFLGSTKAFVRRVNTTDRADGTLELTIIRRTRIIDHVFTGSVALLVSLLYINFGAALDVTVLRSLLARPVAPIIGFLTQFIIMPLLGYGLGVLIFPDSPELQLGLFFTGVSPSGGASNIWAVILGGNINLSVLMTTISNFAAFGMMPLWIFTLGQLIFDRANITVPYANIATFAVSLVVPLAIGLAIQRWLPRVARVLVRLLKPISTCLILFIVIFAIVTNLYLFKLFSWQIIVAGLALPWLGYVFGWCAAKALRRSSVDSLTIAIETGIQNTGISIFLLRFSLPQPEADLTTVIPVSVAILTPFPLLGLYIYKRCAERGIVEGQVDTQTITPTHRN
ncbi:P3 protein-like [Rhagoletis pomonella]|uniref:P3 protein-like n=1 Tax=Rhagoletis pomonella TaxID=28610 RepID=UPI0017820BBE|nr:P3 protein-like [Rhagoletis pomonella]XP_036345900.1 P3 protein-like [Rhagoletis pomonella]XP_036345901.1 P3 protein-like [Rhagoletis pomonella]XP_036345902.1 P3 protein-like [Rhagoletis pomonella]XP_036345903.1 P3 protein-like [Rhagoletis pomonella]